MEIIIAILLVFVVGIVGLWIIGTLYGEEEKDKEEGTGYIPEAMLHVPVLDKEKGTGYIGKEQGKGEMVEFICNKCGEKMRIDPEGVYGTNDIVKLYCERCDITRFEHKKDIGL